MILSHLIKRIASPVNVVDLNRTRPISKVFGLDRGKALDRYYIEKYLEKNLSGMNGRWAEISEDTYLQKFGEQISQKEIFDISPNSKATIVGDLTNVSTLPKSMLDGFVCTQTLNFIYDVDKAIQGVHHTLKPGGFFLGSVAGISQVSRYDMDRWGDFWRFTSKSLEMALSKHFNLKEIEIQAFGNVATCIAFLQGCSLEDIKDKRMLDDHDSDYQMVICFKARKCL